MTEANKKDARKTAILADSELEQISGGGEGDLPDGLFEITHNHMEKKRTTRTQTKLLPGNKSRVLFLRSYLEEHTDDEHYLTTEELIKVYSDNGYKATRQTIADDVAVLNA